MEAPLANGNDQSTIKRKHPESENQENENGNGTESLKQSNSSSDVHPDGDKEQENIKRAKQDEDYKSDKELEEKSQLDKLKNTKSGAHHLSKLDGSVADALFLMSDESAFQKALFISGIDTEKLPMEKITKPLIEEGYKILSHISHIFSDPKEDPVDLLLHSYNFYKILPQRIQAGPYYPSLTPGVIPPVIQSQQQLESKYRMLENLNIVCCGLDLIRESKESAGNNQSYLDLLSDRLNVSLVPLDRTSSKCENVMRYINNTIENSPYILENIFSVEHKEDMSVRPPENRLLLSRGVHLFKELSVLQNGVENSSFKETSLTSNAILFSDMLLPSIEESFSGDEHQSVLVLLYEVALGTAYEGDFIVKELPKGFNSVICRGTIGPDLSQNIPSEEGYMIPVGKPRPYHRGSFAASLTKYYVYKKEQMKIAIYYPSEISSRIHANANV